MTNLDNVLKADKCSSGQSYGFSITSFSSNHEWMWELDHKKADEDHMKIIKKGEELMLLNCGVGEDSWDYLGLQGDQTSPS